MRQRHVQHNPTADLNNLAKKIAEVKALPIRTDFSPMQLWPIDKIPSKEMQQQFGLQFNKSMRMHAQSVMQDGHYKFADIEHQLIAYFELAILVKTFKLGNCDAFCGYVLDYLFENDLNIPFSMLALNNYQHVCVVLGVNLDEKNYVQRGVHLITDDIYKGAIILDLWNKTSSIQRPDQFPQAMKELFNREAGFCVDPSTKSTVHEFSVRCLFHLAKPVVYRDFYQRNFPTLQSLKKFYEEKIENFPVRSSPPPQAFFQSAPQAAEEDPGCCSMLIQSITNLIKRS